MSARNSGAYVVKTAGEAWSIVHAAAIDHANRHMRAAGRTRWNRADDEVHTEHLYRLLTSWGFWSGERRQPTRLYLAMMADRDVPFVIADEVMA